MPDPTPSTASLLSSAPVIAAAVAGAVSLVVGIITSYLTLMKMRQENLLMFQAERVARALMMDSKWRWRSFEIIKHHLGGFDDDELRKILVRAGAIRTKAKNGKEVWGLLERNKDFIGVEQLETSPGYRRADEP